MLQESDRYCSLGSLKTWVSSPELRQDRQKELCLDYVGGSDQSEWLKISSEDKDGSAKKGLISRSAKVGRSCGDVVCCEGVPVPVTQSHHQAVDARIHHVNFQVLGTEGWVIDIF